MAMYQKRCRPLRISAFPIAPILSFALGPAGCHRGLCSAFRHRAPHPVDLEADDADAVDGMVLAVDDAFDDEAMITVEQVLDRLKNTDARVYVVVQALSKNNKQADEVLDRLYRACILRDLPWCDGVVICAGSGIAALRHSPRMGLLRRPFSEAMDKLVGAVRMGCSIEHAQLLGGGNAGSVDADGMVRARPAVPAPIWRAIIKRLGAHVQSRI